MGEAQSVNTEKVVTKKGLIEGDNFYLPKKGHVLWFSGLAKVIDRIDKNSKKTRREQNLIKDSRNTRYDTGCSCLH